MNRTLGSPVAEPSAAPAPSRVILQGRTVTLEPLQASLHTEALFPHICGDDRSWLWDYMTTGPPTDVEQLRALLAGYEKSDNPLFWAIKVKTPPSSPPTKEDNEGKEEDYVGYISFLNIVPAHRTIEVGHVMYSPALQRTTAATEAVYLLARYAFRELGYRRLEWKCNNLNEGSKRAALRYGFTYEGLFRQHLILKGHNRDTAWFSLLDSEWEGGVEGAFEGWLDAGNFDEQGRQKEKLEGFVSRAK